MELKLISSTQEARKVLYWLIGLDLALVLVYIGIHIAIPGMSWGPARALFDLDSELSIPAWYSSVQLFLTGSLLYMAARNNQHKHHVPSSFLIAGCLLFIFLSADEGAAIHEKLTRQVRNAEMTWLLFGGNHGAWITIYSLLALSITLVGARYFKMMWSHFHSQTLIALGGAITFVAGGVGFEIVSYLFLRSGSPTVLYKIEVACEEFLEMSGMSIMLYAMLLIAAAVSAPSSRVDAQDSDQHGPLIRDPAPYAAEQTHATADGQEQSR